MVVTIPVWLPYVSVAVVAVLGLLFLGLAKWQGWLMGTVLSIAVVAWSGTEWSLQYRPVIHANATPDVVVAYDRRAQDDRSLAHIPVQCAAALCLSSLAFGVFCLVMVIETYPVPVPVTVTKGVL